MVIISRLDFHFRMAIYVKNQGQKISAVIYSSLLIKINTINTHPQFVKYFM